MTPEQIRNQVQFGGSTSEVLLAEIAAQLAELNEKFSDYFATLETEEK